MIMKNRINAEAAHKVVATIRQTDFEKYDNLQHLMAQFQYIRLREGFILDVFNSGSHWGAAYVLYARHKNANKEVYFEIEDDVDDTEI